MANPERGEYDVTVNGQVYTLTLKTAGMMALQKHFSTPGHVAGLEEIFRKVAEDSVEHQVAMLWACLRKYHPDITFAQAVEWIDDANGLGALMGQLDDIATSTRPDPKDVEELRRPQKARATRRRGTGGKSSSNHAASV